MTADKRHRDDIVEIGDEMPRIGTVAVQDLYRIVVSWTAGPRHGRADIVDLAPVILSFKLYRPLRDNGALFKTVRLIDDGAALAWDGDDEIDMAATTVERLADEAMSPSDFSGWLKRNHLTFDGAAAQLGISRRLVGYYASTKMVPRHIVLACKYLDRAEATEVGRVPHRVQMNEVLADDRSDTGATTEKAQSVVSLVEALKRTLSSYDVGHPLPPALPSRVGDRD